MSNNPLTTDNYFPFIDTSKLQSVDRDNQQAYTLLRLLVTPFEKYKAYHYGIIDANGKELRKYSTLKTYDEKKSYSRLVRLMIAVKKIINRYPQEAFSFQNVYLALKAINEEKQFKFTQTDIITEDIYKQKLLNLINEEIATAPTVTTSSTSGGNYSLPIGKVKRYKNIDELLYLEI